MHPRQFIANFDSTASLMRGLISYLNGKSHPNVGVFPKPASPLLRVLASSINKLSPKTREKIYTASGATEAVSPGNLSKFSAERTAEYFVGQYPQRKYQAMMIGSSNGAATHLCAALGIPWLPQTQLIPVRRLKVDPNDPQQELEWSLEPARALLDANPELQLHHMLDPVQDLLMSKTLAYFRVKRIRLGEAYSRFMVQNLQPGGVILVMNCRLKWPTTRISDRHLFQFGALGGATVNEFFNGGPRVEEYLARHGVDKHKWNPPEPNEQNPEAEWGFAPQLLDDIEEFASRYGFIVRVINIDQPEHLSPLTADLYRWWYKSRGLLANRMLIESFMLVEPYWALRTASIPYWIPFSTEPYDSVVEQYISSRPPIDEIGLTLFPHGTESIGLVSLDRWREILGMARRRGIFMNIDEIAYPRDMAALVRYHTEIDKHFAAKYPLPGYLALEQFDEFITTSGVDYPVTWGSLGPEEEIPEASTLLGV